MAKADRITTKYLTKYERARILGARALQIRQGPRVARGPRADVFWDSMGAPVMVERGDETDPLFIAMKELRERKIPTVIRRYLPNGDYEDW